jgi:hypothetical protein
VLKHDGYANIGTDIPENHQSIDDDGCANGRIEEI